jgi:RNA polymerase sigma-70 factor (ECF subfamily)
MADPAFQRLVGLISANHDDLFRYVYSLLPHPDDARDVLQETLLELTRKFAQYDEARPFLPWACRFAYHQVLRHRDRNPRKLTYLPPDLLELLAREREVEEPALAARLAALDECLGRLPPDARKLVHGRYAARVPLEELAGRLGLSRRTLFRRLEHLRRSLFECVDRRLADGEAFA